jgi:hypothetical protein
MLNNPVLANIGLPMVAVYLPAAWLALVPIIFIESAYGRWRYKLPFGRALTAESVANCLSTLIGIPVTWLVLVLTEFVALEWGGRVIPKSLLPILTPVLGAAWLAPTADEGRWIIAGAVAVLTVLFYLMSVASEGFVVRRFFRESPNSTIRTWMLQANAITYGLLLLLIMAGLLLPKASVPVTRFLQPVSDVFVDSVFLVIDRASDPRRNEPLLIQAVASSDLEKARHQIAKGADVNQTNGSGFSALCIAATKGDENMTKLLLHAGASVNAPCSTLSPALGRAAQYGNVPTVRALLEAGAEVDDKDHSGWTPLFDAVLSGDVAIVEVLLSAGADVNARTPTGWTALKEAQMRGDQDIAGVLTKAGAIDYPNGSRH